MLILVCENCQIRLQAYDSWVQHVLSEQHQVNSAIKRVLATKNVEESYEKGLLAISADLTNLEASTIAWHVSNFGLLCDLFIGPNNKYIIFHMDSQDCNEAALSGTTDVEDIKVSVQWLSNIPVGEWDGLFTLPRKPHPPKPPPESPISLPRHYYGFMSTIFAQETLSQDELVRRNCAISDIASIIKEEFPHGTFHPYGSYITGLGNADSSLNVFVGNLQIVVPQCAPDAVGSAFKPPVVTRVTIEVISQFLSNLPPSKKSVCGGISIVTTPDSQRFIQFCHPPTKLRGNIYIRNPLPVQRSKLIAFYMTLDERVRPFLQLVRYWGRFHGITAGMPGVNKPTVMRNYALMLLALVFLENVQIIPTIQTLQLMQKDERELCPVGPWEGSFCSDREHVLSYMEMTKNSAPAPTVPKLENPNDSLENKVTNLALEFFNRLSLLEPNSLVVCTLIGKFKPKFQFYRESVDETFEGMERYQQAIKSGKFRAICSPSEKNSKQNNIALVIQDPFELTVNVTEHLSPEMLIKFRLICCKTALAFQRLVDPERRNIDIGTAIRDLFSPVPQREINHSALKSVVGELMVIRRQQNKKNSNGGRANGVVSTPQPLLANLGPPPLLVGENRSHDMRPKPLMSIQPFLGDIQASRAQPLPLIPPTKSQSPLSECAPDFTRRPVVPPPPKVIENKEYAVKISIDSQFQSVFIEYFSRLTEIDAATLNSKMNSLWLLCFSELVLSVWHKCFKLNDVYIRDKNSTQIKQHVYSNHLLDFIEIDNSSNKEEPARKRRRGSNVDYIEDGEIDELGLMGKGDLMEKLEKIPQYSTTFESTFEFFVHKPFFNGRQDISKWMTAVKNQSPLDREEEITKKLLVRCDNSDVSINSKIVCTVVADMTKEDEQIVLSFHESFEKTKPYVEDTFFQRFFSLLIPEYSIYRLCQLLEIPNLWQVVNFNK